ncbi:MAG TPA: DUF72 domain-containing protein [Chloroflexi bacterium]|nr:DUF72 domain-containing protein [Chloroflexota bacterium]
MVKVKLGCCGFPKARNQYYEALKLVEIQQTFYKPPKLETASKWRKEAPPGFEFTLKAWQLITHHATSPTYRKAKLNIPPEARELYGFFRPTEEVFKAWETTRAIAEALKAKIIVFQCPARFTPTGENIANMKAFFSQIDRGNFTLVWEPRGKWEDETIAALCEELGLVHCVDPFQRLPVTRGLAYFRLHGKTGYYYRYTRDDLMWLADLCSRYDEVYVLFNNVSMWESALELQGLLG